MAFALPIALLALAPWAGFSLWLLWGRRRRIVVPFLKLWDAPQELRQPRDKSLQPPPLYMILSVVSLLAAIIAVAQPQLVRREPLAGLTIVLDRGASMSALAAGEPRFLALAREVSTALQTEIGRGPARLIELPGGPIRQTTRSDWLSLAQSAPRTAADTSDELRATAAELLEKKTPALLLTDQSIELTGTTLLHAAPVNAVRNAGITHLAVAQGQVMARLTSNFTGRATLTILSGNRTIPTPVELQPGAPSTVFVDLPAPDPLIEARLEVVDDFDGDNLAWLARSRRWPGIEFRTAVGDELRRFIQVYSRHRPPDSASARIAITRPDAPSEDSAVILAADGAETSQPFPTTPTAHAVLEHVSLATLAQGAAIASRGPGEGWTILARTGNRPILAVRETGDRRRTVWVGFTSRAFARSADFVVFWTNTLDWLAGPDTGYRASRLGDDSLPARRVRPATMPAGVDPAHWPGVFDDSGPVAANAPPVSFASPPSNWRTGLTALRNLGTVTVPLTSWLAALAAALLAGAFLTWERQRPLRPATHPLEPPPPPLSEKVVEANGHAHRKNSAKPV